jgi:hypothetical protein
MQCSCLFPFVVEVTCLFRPYERLCGPCRFFFFLLLSVFSNCWSCLAFRGSLFLQSTNLYRFSTHVSGQFPDWFLSLLRRNAWESRTRLRTFLGDFQTGSICIPFFYDFFSGRSVRALLSGMRLAFNYSGMLFSAGIFFLNSMRGFEGW